MQREKTPPAVVDYADLATFEPQTRRQPDSSFDELARFIEWIDKYGGRFIPLRIRDVKPTHKNFSVNGVLSAGEVICRDIDEDGNVGLVPWTGILVIDVDTAEALARVREVLEPRFVTGVLNSCGGGLHLILKMPEGAEPMPQADGDTPMGEKVDTRGGNDTEGFIVFSRSHAIRPKYPGHPDGLFYWFRHFNPNADPVPLEVLALFRKPGATKASASNRAPGDVDVDLPDGLTEAALDGSIRAWKWWGLAAEHDGTKEVAGGIKYASRHTMANNLARLLGSRGFCRPQDGLLFVKHVALDYFGLSDDATVRDNIWRGYIQGLKNYRNAFPRAPWPDAKLFDLPRNATSNSVVLQYLYALDVEWLFNTADQMLYIKGLPDPVRGNMVGEWEAFEISGDLVEILLDRLTSAARPVPIPLKVLRMEEDRPRTPVKPEQVIEVDLAFPGDRKHPHPDSLVDKKYKNAARSIARRKERQLVRAVFFDDPQYFPEDWRDLAMDDGGRSFVDYTKLQGYPSVPTVEGCKWSEFDFAVRANELIYECLLMRLMHPGCYIAEIPAWIGPGGTGKSAEFSLAWPLGMAHLFVGNAKYFDHRISNDEKKLFEFLRGLHCLTFNELRLFDEIALNAFISLSDALVDKVRPNYMGSWPRLRDWLMGATFQRKGHIPDLGRGSGERRWLVLERTGVYPGQGRRSGSALWRAMVLDELNLALWRWTRLKLEYPEKKPGVWHPRLSKAFQIVDPSGKPLVYRNAPLKDKEEHMPEKVPVPMILRNEEKDWAREQDLRVRGASVRRAAEADLTPLRDLLRERAEVSGEYPDQRAGFIGSVELGKRFPNVPTAKLQEVLDEEGWHSGARLYLSKTNRPSGYKYHGRAPGLDLDDPGTEEGDK